MKRSIRNPIRISLLAAAAMAFLEIPVFAADFPAPPAEPRAAAGPVRTAVLAGGCFWGVEAVFARLAGVSEVVSGYSGGRKESADYDTVSSGTTGHAESVRITYDPSRISYGTLLQIFFSVAHDPTQLNYQGPDHGTQYRSVIFYADADQKKVAEEYIRKLTVARAFSAPIVTQLVPLAVFYPAEDYHQDFIRNNPDYPYVVYWDLPKIAHLEKAYPGLLAKK